MAKNPNSIEPKLDASKVFTAKGLNIDEAVKFVEQVLHQANKGSGLFHKGRGDKSVDVGEMLEFMEKNGVPLKERLAAKKELPHNLSVKIDDAAQYFRDSLNKLNTDKDTKNLSPTELAPLFQPHSKTPEK